MDSRSGSGTWQKPRINGLHSTIGRYSQKTDRRLPKPEISAKLLVNINGGADKYIYISIQVLDQKH